METWFKIQILLNMEIEFFFAGIEILEKVIFKSVILCKKKQFWLKYKFWSKIKILVKNKNFGQK